MDQYVTAIANDVMLASQYFIPAISGIAGAIYAMTGMFAWYEAAQGRDDTPPRVYFTKILVAAVLLAFTGSMVAGTGAPTDGFLGATNLNGGGTFAVLALQSGTLTGEAVQQANTTIAAVMALLTAVGWMAQLRGVIMAKDIGSARSDASLWRVSGYIVGGAVLADMPNVLKAIDATLKTGIFS